MRRLRLPVRTNDRSLMTGHLYGKLSDKKWKGCLQALEAAAASPGKQDWKLVVIDHEKHNWSPTEIQRLLRKLEFKPSQLLVESGSGQVRAKPSSAGYESDVLATLSLHPHLMQSPIFEIGSRAVIGWPPSAAVALLADTLRASAASASSAQAVQWEVFRVDIHGTEVSMKLFNTKEEADAMAKMFQDRGHHQVYFVKRVPDC